MSQRDPSPHARAPSQRAPSVLVPLRRRSDPRVQLPPAFASELTSVVEGEVRFDSQARGLYAMDASNFRIPPLGVVLPESVEDVERAVAACRRHGVSIVSRGGGTGLAGQALNRGIVIDHSKFLREVLELDPQRKLARVQAGCVLDQLRSQAEPYGLTFGPDPSTHDRCTLGGMVGNNACGTHAILAEFYGPGPRTEHSVEALEVLTYDGTRMRVGPTSDADYAAIQLSGGRRADVYRQLRALRDRHADAIRRGFPRIQRRVSGYNLPALLPENGFDVAAALVGSEGTCATVLEVTARLSPRLPERVLLILGYPSIEDAADDVPRIRECKPVGLEGIDELLVDLMKRKHMHVDDLSQLPEGSGWLLVEFGADERAEARDAARRCMAALERSARPPEMKLLEDAAAQKRVWEVRESGLGATAFVPGKRDSWPGFEDSAVPVDRVGAYLRELKRLYARHGYEAALYGHFGQGCVHTRIDFDLTSADGIDAYRRFTREAAELCVRHGGSLSGEHGDGQQRSDLLPVMYDPQIVQAFREFKAIWDPQGKMNPGRIVDPLPRDADLRLGEDYDPWHPATRFQYPADNGDFAHAALRCVGVGKCRRAHGGTMCPSYMATHEETHSTRGRARLLFEMVQRDVVSDGWQSEEVKDALELCLSCKACKRECPVGVDMAKYKAEFLAHHYRARLRPRQAYAFGLIDRWARIGSAIPQLANWVTHAKGLRAAAKWAAGMAPEREVPAFARKTFRRAFAERPARAVVHDGRRVILWPDTFNNHFLPSTLHAAVDVLSAAHVQVALPSQPLCCGRPLYDYGMLERGRRYFERILDVLEPEIEAGTPVVGLEPSCVVALRDELPALLGHDGRASALARQTYTLSEYLTKALPEYHPPGLAGRALVQAHCQGSAVLGTEHDDRLLRGLGLEFERPDAGCCGMAGSFGFERGAKYRVSIAAGERVLLPAVRESPPDTLIIANGFSCREQIQQCTERTPLHIAQVLQLAHAHAG